MSSQTIARWILKILWSPIRLLFMGVSLLLKIKIKYLFFIIFGAIILITSINMSIQEGDATILLKEIPKRVFLSDYELNTQLQNNPLNFPDVSHENNFQKVKILVDFLWRNINLLSLVWWSVGWIYLIYLIVKPRNKSEVNMNFFIATGIYIIWMMVGSKLLFNDFVFPFQGLVLFIQQLLTNVIPNFGKSFTPSIDNGSLSNISGGNYG